MTTTHALLTIVVMALITFGTRVAAFLLFDRGAEPPKIILYLGKMLPPAVIAMLIIYCLKDVDFTSLSHIVPQLLAVATVVVLHLYKRNNLISILGGTVLYMFLVQVVFV